MGVKFFRIKLYNFSTIFSCALVELKAYSVEYKEPSSSSGIIYKLVTLCAEYICSGKVKLVNSVNPLAFRFTFTIIDYRSIMSSNTNLQSACK